MNRYFEGCKHAVQYAKFRPIPPFAVIEKIIEYLKEKITYLDHALDIGCGTGQTTALLSPYFKQVTGIDVSKAQIEEAIKNNKLQNIKYKVSTAEEIKLQNQSIQLITAGQSVHWFNLPKFYKEVDRLLIRNGVLAMYGYSVMMPYPSNTDARIKASDIVNKFYDEDMGSHWPSERCHIDNAYENIIFPYHDHIRTTIVNQTETSLLNYFGYFTTWSSYQKLLKEDPKKAKFLMNRFQNRLMEALSVSTKDVSLNIRTNYFILLGRKDIN